jgi:hypothetical protein
MTIVFSRHGRPHFSVSVTNVVHPHWFRLIRIHLYADPDLDPGPGSKANADF